ncbi:MAG: GNAT family N-acetyltransferase [Alphaproteobacteria bacterium]
MRVLTPAQRQATLNLETERLRLRAPVLKDFGASAALCMDDEVMRFITGRVATREEAWARFMRWVGHWSLCGFGFWLVEEKSSNYFVGEIGVADLKRDLDPAMDAKLEAGWVLATWAHGKGFATEAMQAVLAWSDQQFSGVGTYCIIDPGHQASLRVAEKCGFGQAANTLYRDEPVVVLQRG